ncbi:MAG TPA: PD-(D/E)XK nuclease-like domain-containing protein, partial [Candidatus Limnocylindrales bacterium]
DCKCRPDAVKKRTLIDLKTARTIDARKFGRNAYDLGYFGQMAFYAEGLAVSTGVGDWEAFLIAVEADQPHDVAVFHIDPDSLYAAGVKAHELLERVAECRESGQWPGRYEDTQTMELPPWELDDGKDEIRILEGLAPHMEVSS